MELRDVRTNGTGWNQGHYYYNTNAELDGVRFTMKQFTCLQAAIEFTARVHGYIGGTYDAEVFDICNAEKQARAES